MTRIDIARVSHTGRVSNSFVRKREGSLPHPISSKPSFNKNPQSTMGNNASSGLGSEVTYGSRDMRYLAAEDTEERPTENPVVEVTAPNRKSHVPRGSQAQSNSHKGIILLKFL